MTSTTSPPPPSHFKPGRTSKHHERHYVKHDYHDYAAEPDDPAKAPIRRRKGGVNIPFPIVLHRTIARVEADGYGHIFGWQPHGRAFLIHKPKQFVELILPQYFQQNKLTSFQRQLNLYGFNRLTQGTDATGYYHEHFLRDREYLAKRMMRQRIKGTKIKGAASPHSEPDFYSMPPVMPTLEQQAQVQQAQQYDAVPSSSTTLVENEDGNNNLAEPLTTVSQELPLVSCDDMSTSHGGGEESSDDDDNDDDDDDSHHRQQPQQQRCPVEHDDQQQDRYAVPSMTDYTSQEGLILATTQHGEQEPNEFADPADALLMDLQSIDPLEDFGLLVVPSSIRKDQALGDMLQYVMGSNLPV